MPIASQPLSQALGALVSGCDLRRPLAQDDQQELRRILDEFQLLLFENQEIESDDEILYQCLAETSIRKWRSNPDPLPDCVAQTGSLRRIERSGIPHHGADSR